VSPLQALRSSYETPSGARRDPLQLFVIALIVLEIITYALFSTERWTYGLGFCAAVGGALALLAGIARGLMSLARSYASLAWPYVWRQGLANLYRPRNQTLMLMLALGLGAFLLMTLQLVQQALIQQVSRRSETNQSNLILFDIQTDQREAIINLVYSFSLPVPQEAPLVTMRLASVKDRSVEELRNDARQEIQDGALQHEYRATYRDHLIDTETLVAGDWQGAYDPANNAPAISLEEEVAHALGVTVGDALVFD